MICLVRRPSPGRAGVTGWGFMPDLSTAALTSLTIFNRPRHQLMEPLRWL